MDCFKCVIRYFTTKKFYAAKIVEILTGKCIIYIVESVCPKSSFWGAEERIG